MKPLVLLKQSFINQCAALFSDKMTFNRFKGVVSRMNDKDVSGEEKRELALEELKIIGVTITGWLLNFLLELAVAYFKSNK